MKKLNKDSNNETEIKGEAGEVPGIVIMPKLPPNEMAWREFDPTVPFEYLVEDLHAEFLDPLYAGAITVTYKDVRVTSIARDHGIFRLWLADDTQAVVTSGQLLMVLNTPIEKQVDFEDIDPTNDVESAADALYEAANDDELPDGEVAG